MSEPNDTQEAGASASEKVAVGGCSAATCSACRGSGETPVRDWPLLMGDCWKCGGSGKVCRVCDGLLKPGIALIPGIYGSEDFGGDYGEPGTTMSEGPGDAVPRKCLKCVDCGHSFIQRNDQAEARRQ